MAQKVDCPCGQTIRGETDDELVSNVEQHIQSDHPEMAGMSREQILGMAQAE
jgi:predicted small metal-binding protein